MCECLCTLTCKDVVGTAVQGLSALGEQQLLFARLVWVLIPCFPLPGFRMGGDHRAFVYAAGASETSWELFLGVGLPKGVKLIWCRCFWMFRGRWSCLHPSTCPSISRSPRVNLLTKKMCSHPQKLGLSERHADEEGSSQRGWLCCSSAQRRQLWSRRLLLSSSLELGGLGWDNRPPGEAQVPLGEGRRNHHSEVTTSSWDKEGHHQ